MVEPFPLRSAWKTGPKLIKCAGQGGNPASKAKAKVIGNVK